MTNPSITDIRRRLQKFSKEHENDCDEKQHEQQFWRDFYACFGISKSSAVMFQARVIKVGGVRGYIDSFIPSVLLVEQKSLGRNLEDAYVQAQAYFHAIANEFEKPKYIITCDFQTFHLYDLQNNARDPLVCKLNELSQRADWFMFLVDKEVHVVSEELPVNRKAAEQIAKLHDALLKANYRGRDLESFLTRLLFCLFADDTGIFGTDGQFKHLVENTKEDGSDLGSALSLLFQVLNTPKDKRQTNLDEALKAFEYVNGSLFQDQIQIPYFDFDLRTILLNCVRLDWSGISPAIFGSMFQAVLEDGATDTAHRKESRNELGAHYTSERNILKVIEPLFLNELHSELENARGSKTKLTAIYNKLSNLKFLDPACGCGNFLVIAYRELRRIENAVINELFFKDKQEGFITTQCRVNISQFYGIEIDGAAAHIARVALYITDHQLNLESAHKFGEARATVPLVATPHIHHANALRMDWNVVIKANECSYVFGNPPFIGKQNQSKDQKDDMEYVASKLKNFGLLDYVSCWYIKSIDYISNTDIPVAFVSTNSITQGEQVPALWSWILQKGIKINFAHRTFKWGNEGKAVAAVHCVIIGFSFFDKKNKELFNYVDDINPIKEIVAHINPYLVDAPSIVLDARRDQVSTSLPIVFGNMANDGGHLFLTDAEKSDLENAYPQSSKFIYRFYGAEEFINNINRWCLWLIAASAEDIRSIPPIYKRIEKVRDVRLKSNRDATKKLASTPYLFGEIRQTNNPYILIPRHSSENRDYIPIGFLDGNVICGDANSMIPNATLSQFAILTSKMHMAWVRVICGRIKSDFRYSNTIVYNNFIFPNPLTDVQINLLNDSANKILSARNLFKNSTLADLYDPLTMPIELIQAHQTNNTYVDKVYGYSGADDDASRVAFMFKSYEKLTSLLPPTVLKKKRKKKTDDVQSNLI